MIEVTPELLKAMNSAEKSIEGLSGLTIAHAVPGLSIRGKRQDCDYPDLGECEWVDQRQYDDDAFYGTVSWRIGEFWLIASFNT